MSEYRDDPWVTLDKSLTHVERQLFELQERMDTLETAARGRRTVDVVKVASRRVALVIGLLVVATLGLFGINVAVHSCSESNAQQWRSGRARCGRACGTIDMRVFQFDVTQGKEKCVCLGDDGRMGRFNESYDEFTWVFSGAVR